MKSLILVPLLAIAMLGQTAAPKPAPTPAKVPATEFGVAPPIAEPARPIPAPARPTFLHGPHRPQQVPPPADVQSWMTQAKTAGGASYQVRCVTIPPGGQGRPGCTARVGFKDGSSLTGQGSTRQAAMAAINFKASHPAPVIPPPPKVENYGGPL